MKGDSLDMRKFISYTYPRKQHHSLTMGIWMLARKPSDGYYYPTSGCVMHGQAVVMTIQKNNY